MIITFILQKLLLFSSFNYFFINATIRNYIHLQYLVPSDNYFVEFRSHFTIADPIWPWSINFKDHQSSSNLMIEPLHLCWSLYLMPINFSVDWHSNLLTKTMQSIWKLSLGFHGIYRNKTFIAHKYLTTCILTGKFGQESSKESISIKYTLDSVLSKHPIIRRKVSWKTNVSILTAQLGIRFDCTFSKRIRDKPQLR